MVLKEFLAIIFVESHLWLNKVMLFLPSLVTLYLFYFLLAQVNTYSKMSRRVWERIS